MPRSIRHNRPEKTRQRARDILDDIDWSRTEHSLPLFQNSDGRCHNASGQQLESATNGGWVRHPRKLQLAAWLVARSLADTLQLSEPPVQKLTARFVRNMDKATHKHLFEARLICPDDDIVLADNFALEHHLPDSTLLRPKPIGYRDSHHVLGHTVVKGGLPCRDRLGTEIGGYDTPMQFIFTGPFVLPLEA